MRSSRSFSVSFVGPAPGLGVGVGACAGGCAGAGVWAESPAVAATAAKADEDVFRKSRRSMDMVVYSSLP